MHFRSRVVFFSSQFDPLVIHMKFVAGGENRYWEATSINPNGQFLKVIQLPWKFLNRRILVVTISKNTVSFLEFQTGQIVIYLSGSIQIDLRPTTPTN